MEVPEDFPNRKLPTLDFEMWMHLGLILHSYYEMSMRTPYVIMKRSAMFEHQRISILSNELIRRLSNVHPDVRDTEIIPIIEHYIHQLKTSGYEIIQTREVSIFGVRGWRMKIERRKREGVHFYRSAKSTLRGRVKKN